MVVNLVAASIDPIITKLAKELSGLAKTKSLELVYNQSTNPLPKVMMDSARIEEVISNLVGNAINYTQKGKVTISLRQENKEVIFSVNDTGPGIPRDALNHLFTKFFRIKGDLEAGSKGTGLGLYISKNIIDAHKGRIWVESEVGVGSTFSFALPIAPETNAHV
jgi:signal transduction histidine kinase